MAGDVRFRARVSNRRLAAAVLGFLGTSVAVAQGPAPQAAPVFETSDQCIACHSNLRDADGQDVSIGHGWRATMMANSARDPYWQAAVRREVMDQPELAGVIEDTCSTCHMPMARTAARAAGRLGEVFSHLSGGAGGEDAAAALDGVSCTVCHQIRPDNFGEHESFDGGFLVGGPDSGVVTAFGPFDDIDEGLQLVMESASGLRPAVGAHIQESELCATCHTLFTAALDDAGREVGRLPEQVPYLEWRHSGYRGEQSCQDCHMPVAAEAPISSVLGEQREGLSIHAFRGGNAFMLRLLNRYREDLGVTAPADELEAAAERTVEHLGNDTARIDRLDVRFEADRSALVEVEVSNLAGHKLPTAYPSRRVWLHLTLRDENGVVLFESGAMRPDGSIAGNENDEDPSAFEPHHAEISAPDQVQIYESIIVDHADRVTTALLRGVRYVKDNRLLPSGFDKASAPDDVAVRGRATGDADFLAGTDTVHYRVPVSGEVTSVTASVRLLFQTIGYRWARNLAEYDAVETKRFVGYYEANAEESAVVLAARSAEVRR